MLSIARWRNSRKKNENEGNSIDCYEAITCFFRKITMIQKTKTLFAWKRAKDVRQKTLRRKRVETFKKSRTSNCFETNYFDRNLFWRFRDVVFNQFKLIEFACSRNSRNLCRQSLRFLSSSQVFFVVKYLFHFTKYRWPFYCKIRSTSYSWSSYD